MSRRYDTCHVTAPTCTECKREVTPLIPLDAMGLCAVCAGAFLRWIETVNLSRGLSRVDYRDDVYVPPVAAVRLDWAA